MDAQELRNLQEAYMEVVENQQLDEGYKRFPYKKVEDKIHKKELDNRWHGTNQTLKMGKVIQDFRGEKDPVSRIEHSPKISKAKERANRERGEEKRNQKEQYDLYDIILSHLLDEGYAETPESAEVIMVNMSEEWRENIMEREYGPDEILPGSGRTPKQKYRAKRGRFMKSKKPSQNETGRQRAQRMAQNYYIGTTKQQYDNFGIGN
jgi:hypothetical protein